MRWQAATLTRIRKRSPTVSSFFFRFPEQPDFVAGQHVVVRLTAPDGYRAQRSYSIASAPEEREHIELAIERLDDGEVSPFFHDVALVGDEIEISEPIGGHFVWPAEVEGSILMAAGGAGIVPFVSMLRHRQAAGLATPVALLFSARTSADAIFHAELAALAEQGEGLRLLTTLTREASQPAGFRSGRIDAALMAEALASLPGAAPRCYACGSNSFVEAATQAMIGCGVDPALLSTERYGV